MFHNPLPPKFKGMVKNNGRRHVVNADIKARLAAGYLCFWLLQEVFKFAKGSNLYIRPSLDAGRSKRDPAEVFGPVRTKYVVYRQTQNSEKFLAKRNWLALPSARG